MNPADFPPLPTLIPAQTPSPTPISPTLSDATLSVYSDPAVAFVIPPLEKPYFDYAPQPAMSDATPSPDTLPTMMEFPPPLYDPAFTAAPDALGFIPMPPPGFMPFPQFAAPQMYPGPFPDPAMFGAPYYQPEFFPPPPYYDGYLNQHHLPTMFAGGYPVPQMGIPYGGGLAAGDVKFAVKKAPVTLKDPVSGELVAVF